MIRATSLAIALVAWLTPTARAQHAPPARPDAGVFVELRDSLAALHGALLDFRRDLDAGGPETVLARATRLAETCRRVRDQITAVLPALRADGASARARTANDSLAVATRGLTRQLDELCVRGLGPVGPGHRADTVRAWGPYRTAQLRRAIVRYENAANRVAGVRGVKIPPRTH